MESQLDGESMRQGTVLDFKTRTNKYTIRYTNGTTAALSKTQLMKILLLVVIEGAAPELAAQQATLAIAQLATLAMDVA